MELNTRYVGKDSERLPGLLVAVVVTFMLFAAINAGFTGLGL